MGRKPKHSRHAGKRKRIRLKESSLSPLAGPEAIPARIVPTSSVPDPISVKYGFVRSRQLEGTYHGDAKTGVWPITCWRISFGWGAVRAIDWPDSTMESQWPPAEPEGLDRTAKRMRRGPYQRVITLGDCKRALAVGQLPIVSLRITEDWFQTERGVILDPRPGVESIGSHAVTFVGYDDISRTITFANSSWGHDWGNEGFGTLSYGYFENMLVEAWITSDTSPTWTLAKSAAQFSNAHEPGALDVREMVWGVRDIVRGGVVHCCEIYDLANDERIGWTLAVPRDGFLDIEDLFVRPAYR